VLKLSSILLSCLLRIRLTIVALNYYAILFWAFWPFLFFFLRVFKSDNSPLLLANDSVSWLSSSKWDYYINLVDPICLWLPFRSNFTFYYSLMLSNSSWSSMPICLSLEHSPTQSWVIFVAFIDFVMTSVWTGSYANSIIWHISTSSARVYSYSFYFPPRRGNNIYSSSVN